MKKFLLGSACGFLFGWGTAAVMKTNVDGNFVRDIAMEQPEGKVGYHDMLVKQQAPNTGKSERARFVKTLENWIDIMKPREKAEAPAPQ